MRIVASCDAAGRGKSDARTHRDSAPRSSRRGETALNGARFPRILFQWTRFERKVEISGEFGVNDGAQPRCTSSQVVADLEFSKSHFAMDVSEAARRLEARLETVFDRRLLESLIAKQPLSPAFVAVALDDPPKKIQIAALCDNNFRKFDFPGSDGCKARVVPVHRMVSKNALAV